MIIFVDNAHTILITNYMKKFVSLFILLCSCSKVIDTSEPVPLVSLVASNIILSDVTNSTPIEFVADVSNKIRDYNIELQLLNMDKLDVDFSVGNELKHGCDDIFLVPMAKGTKKGALMLTSLNVDLSEDYSIVFVVLSSDHYSCVNKEIKITLND